MQRVIVTQNNQAEVAAQAAEVLEAGGLVLFPTETTYGAGVDATNPEAVTKLLQYKARREGKPLSIAVTNRAMAEQYVELNAQARALYQQFLPGPVTVISKSLGRVAPGVASEFDTLGVRIPDYPPVTAIVAQLDRPMTATSANPSDGARPYSISKLLTTLSGRQLELIDLILDAGELPHNPPSTVIDTTLSTPVTMRQGNITLSQTRETTSPGSIDPNSRMITIKQYSVGQPNPSDSANPVTTNPTLTLQSSSPEETMGIAGRLLLKHWNDVRQSGLIIGLNGPLGAGKTVFAQGVAQFLGIAEQLTSPTYTYSEEYPYTRHQTSGTLHHLDMWKVDSPEVFDRLEFGALLHPNNIVIVEWWSQVEAHVLRLIQQRQLLTATPSPTALTCTIE